ncbi:MAG: hypothetical protein AAGI01_09810 [Myxococcota bacterium]
MTTPVPNKWTAYLFICLGALSTPAALYGIVSAWLVGLDNLPHSPKVALMGLMFHAAIALGYMLLDGYVKYARGAIRLEKIALLWKGTIAYNLAWAVVFCAVVIKCNDAREFVLLPLGQLALAGLGARAYIRDMWALAERGYDVERLSKIFA